MHPPLCGERLGNPQMCNVAHDPLHGDSYIRVKAGEGHWPQTFFLVKSLKKPFNETSFEQMHEGSQRLSHKYSETVWAKRIGKIHIFSLCWNPEIIPFIFLSGTDQGFINSFPTPNIVQYVGALKKQTNCLFFTFHIPYFHFNLILNGNFGINLVFYSNLSFCIFHIFFFLINILMMDMIMIFFV